MFMDGRKRIILLMMVLILILGVTLPNTEAAGGPQIALIITSLTGNVYLSQVYGFMDEAEKMGIPKPIILAAGGYDKIDVQIKQVEDMIAAKVDAIAITPISKQGLTPVIDRAIDQGIIVLHFGQISSSQKVKATIRSPQEKMGRRLGKAIGESLKGKGNVVMFNGPAGATWAQLETKGFKDVIEEDYPEIKILAEKWTIYDTGVAMNTMSDLLQTFPNNIDYIYTSFDTYAEGAARGLLIADKKIKMATANLTPATFQMLKDGTLEYVVGTGMVAEGRMAIQTLIKMFKGEEVPSLQFTPSIDYWAEDVQANPDGFDTSAEFFPEGWTYKP